MQQYENLRAVAGAHNGLIGYGVIPVNEAGKSLTDFTLRKREFAVHDNFCATVPHSEVSAA
jgi:ABC-type phosphate/phosphonate transport system permease subunit